MDKDRRGETWIGWNSIDTRKRFLGAIDGAVLELAELVRDEHSLCHPRSWLWMNSTGSDYTPQEQCSPLSEASNLIRSHSQSRQQEEEVIGLVLNFRETAQRNG